MTSASKSNNQFEVQNFGFISRGLKTILHYLFRNCHHFYSCLKYFAIKDHLLYLRVFLPSVLSSVSHIYISHNISFLCPEKLLDCFCILLWFIYPCPLWSTVQSVLSDSEQRVQPCTLFILRLSAVTLINTSELFLHARSYITIPHHVCQMMRWYDLSVRFHLVWTVEVLLHFHYWTSRSN